MVENKTAIIFGVTGQSPSYLAEKLLQEDYNVIGVKRRTSADNTWRLTKCLHDKNFELLEGDVTDFSSCYRIITKHLYSVDVPLLIYNAAAQSHVATSFQEPIHTWNVTAGGALNLLECLRLLSSWQIKFCQFSSSEMYGNCPDGDYQDETTEMIPNSPYAVAKLAAHRAVRIYREAYNLFVCSAIFFNMESPRRGELFVTRKITKYVGELMAHRISKYSCKPFPKLKLGNLNAYRDWSHAIDSMNAAYLILQNDYPSDYVVATGKTHTVAEFCKEAFKYAGIHDWEHYIKIDETLKRPKEVDYLRGNATKIKKELYWAPSYSFEKLAHEMVANDVKMAIGG